MSRPAAALLALFVGFIAWICTSGLWLVAQVTISVLVAGLFLALVGFDRAIAGGVTHTHDAEDAPEPLETPARHVADHTRRPGAGGDDGVLL